MSLRRLVLPLLCAVSATSVVAACAGPPSSSSSSATTSSATSFTPVSLDNCGDKVTVSSPPTRLVTLNQGATEVALALGLEGRMVGTAYLDDEISPRYAAAYKTVPVLSKEYPSQETFLAARPDFAYAAYASAFESKAVGTRNELQQKRIGTYLSPFGCADVADKAAPTFESAWKEITQVGSIFDVTKKAESVVADQQGELADVRKQAAGKGLKILWYDSADKTPFVGGGGGGPQLVIDAVGGTNIFANIKGGWGDGSWEKVVSAQPDVIVLADASWDTAAKKKAYLKNDPVLKKLEAVQDNAFVVVPFSESTPGVRLVEGAHSVSDQLAALNLK
ncbi:ABC transporter substrate-binding protein [Nostocoides japonicum]|uniref:ABC transporter substrate-binding protein n=1 Tax=Nostocoides japonicum TaxID=99481 RepID=UPI0009F9F738|nr:ABC transporter substrate-binding protein [Tetrasphaera japonica]